MHYKTLKGIVPDSYAHPFDKAALSTLERTKGLNLVVNYITKNLVERMYTVQYKGSNLKITKKSYPQLYGYLELACKILDIDSIPDLYTQWDYSINAFTVGSENPLIVLNSGLVDICDDDEIMFIIGHELGHIKSKHMLYHLSAQIFNIIISQIPFGNIASAPLQYAIYYWDRMSEFTADRAGLLCCQNRQAAVKAFMKMAGIPKSQFDSKYDSFIQQAEDFEQLSENKINALIKFLSIVGDTHPWTVARASELLKWTDYYSLMSRYGVPINSQGTSSLKSFNIKF